jgi:hypothetical protein
MLVLRARVNTGVVNASLRKAEAVVPLPGHTPSLERRQVLTADIKRAAGVAQSCNCCQAGPGHPTSYLRSTLIIHPCPKDCIVQVA